MPRISTNEAKRILLLEKNVERINKILKLKDIRFEYDTFIPKKSEELKESSSMEEI